MRLFTALDLPPDILLRLEELLSVLRPTAPVKWSPTDNLHITTKFIGEWPEPQIDRLDKVLQKLRGRKPIDIELRDMGWFPNAQSPRVLWAGVNGSPALIDLAACTEDALANLGIARDQHSYSPHLTLARIRSAVAMSALRTKVDELQSLPIGKFRSSSFYLYCSEPGATASIYRKLHSYPFETAPQKS